MSPAVAAAPVTRRVVVAVATYRRPDDLSAILPLLVAQAADSAHRARVLVVDNDPDGGARQTCLSLGLPAGCYVHEPEPGIAAARNRALDEAPDDDLLVFIDDDERPQPQWLERLVSTFETHAVAGVIGPVHAVIDGELDPWISAGRFFVTPRRPTGTPMRIGATNNLLLDLAVIRRLGLRFDERFGLSGGSDTLFTARLSAAGERLTWCDEAVVDNVVPAARTSREWVLRRQFRSGNTASRVEVELPSSPAGRLRRRFVQTARGSARVLTGAARAALGRVRSDLGHEAGGARTMARGAGMVAGAWGHVYQEYRRPPAARTERRLTVLQSARTPGSRTNPYLLQLVDAMSPSVETLWFSWPTAFFRRYDVLHLHWPEVLQRRDGRLAHAAAVVRSVLLIARTHVAGTVVVRTVHNEQPHESGGPVDRLLLRWWDRRVRRWILLSPATGAPASAPGVVIPHGHYRDWFATAPAAAPEPGRLLFFGLIRPMKNVDGLVRAFAAVPDPQLSLHVVGDPRPVVLRDAIIASAAGDDRVALRFDYVGDGALAAEIRAAQLVVLPYREMGSSGAVLLALSLGRPVLVPDTASMRSLADEVGPEWVRRYPGELDADAIAHAVAAVAELRGEPALGSRDWPEVARLHVACYRDAVGAEAR